MSESILHPKLHGTIVVSGLPGLGKSTLGFTAERPDKTFILDFDLKGKGMAKDYGIEQYYSPDFMTPDMDPSDYDANKISTWAVEKMKTIKPGTTNVVIDNATAWEAGMAKLVEKNPTKYGLNAKNVAAGIYGGANPGISILWQNMTSWLQSMGVQTVFMINHMSQPWANGAPVPNRYHIRGNKIFRQLSILTLIVVPSDTKRGGLPPLPSALVAKEALAVRNWSEEKQDYETKRALPMRIPIAGWKEIKQYFLHPADFSNPKPGEVWTDAEVFAYGEFMSAEQVGWIKDAAKIAYNEDGNPEMGTTSISTKPSVIRKSEPRKVITPPVAGELTVDLVKAAWLAEAQKVGMLKDYNDGIGMALLKSVLGETYAHISDEGTHLGDAKQIGTAKIMTWKPG